jgi:tryptophan synthase beta chain
MVTWLQSIVGREARAQILEIAGRLPTRVYACVGGGSNALGIFDGFMDDPEVELVGVEAGGEGIDSGRHAARLASPDGSIGVAQGYCSYFLQDQDGQMRDTQSAAAGLDYVGVSPILAHHAETRRVRFTAASDAEMLEALSTVARHEGILPALESSHAFAQALKEASTLPPDAVVLINQSGRADKDIFTVADAFGDEQWQAFLRRKAGPHAS